MLPAANAWPFNLRRKKLAKPPMPDWLKVRLKFDTAALVQSASVREALKSNRIPTVCEEASCPNLGHCWSQGTATFMIMGTICTRRCGFCDVATGRPLPLDPLEPERLARTVQTMGLRHAVITSVDRDELKDCGSMHFARTIAAVRRLCPDVRLEVLIPDFKGRPDNLERIADAGPDIVNHNLETVPELFASVCPQSNYEISLKTLKYFSEKGFLTKSGLIMGLGETVEQIRQALRDLRSAGVAMLTIGQYLPPDDRHAPLKEYIAPETFRQLKMEALSMGFGHVEAGPLVRSSYHAGDAFAHNQP
ncbi:MAG: lipoyl synthase [Spirochaetales bacterium]|nr:lipoyl synthase [Spirochaetales bacterium]